MLQSIQGYPLRASPELIDSVETYAGVIDDLPTTSRTWLNARTSVIRSKTVVGKINLDPQFQAWHISSSFLMLSGRPAQSLDRSILDYQIDKWEHSDGPSLLPVDGASHFPHPIRTGTLATLYAARLLYYDVLWLTDKHVNVSTDMYTYWKIAHRAGYIWEQHLARLKANRKDA